jgi:adenylate cyclase
MGTEIERKFLVRGDAWRGEGKATKLAQGYLAVGPPVAVRVRVTDDRAILNIKTSTQSITRSEFEYEIPMDDAKALLAESCMGSIIEKTRYLVPHAGNTWEVDEFHGDNDGLVVAEIELDAEDAPFEKPPWLGEEVSHDPRYLNSHLSQEPYCDWKHSVTHE